MSDFAQRDLELFKRLAVNEPHLRAYLTRLLEQELKILLVNQVAPTLHVAQGKAQAYSKLVDLLDGKAV
jgi:hypothetical protein